jgi:D-beta-D-heptose 7-phosphate kinase/D-beta-D-heptose 1-phosphate adenosyltransferase
MAKILVIGDSCTDVHIYGMVNRLCPDAPVPITIPVSEYQNGGMAANTFDNLVSLGNQVDLITNFETIEKTRYVDKKTNQMMLRVDTGPTKLEPCDNSRIYNVNYDNYDAVVISDYDKGFLTEHHICYISSRHPLVFVDTKKLITSDMMRYVRFFKINQYEYERNLEAWQSIMEGYQPEKIKNKLIVTYGSNGCVYMDREYKVDKVSIKDNSGAGDSFLSGLVTEYLNTKNIDTAIEFANKCATVVVQQRGVVKVGDYI